MQDECDIVASADDNEPPSLIAGGPREQGGAVG